MHLLVLSSVFCFNYIIFYECTWLDQVICHIHQDLFKIYDKYTMVKLTLNQVFEKYTRTKNLGSTNYMTIIHQGWKPSFWYICQV